MTNTTKIPKRCVNLDWLEVYVIEHDGDKTADYYESLGYTVERRPYGTPQYREMFTVLYDGEPFVEIRRNPYSLKCHGGIFRDGSSHIRLANCQLYTVDPIGLLRRFLLAHHYEYVSISRVDVCLDFNTFDNGWLPNVFIDQYMKSYVSKVTQSNMAAHGCDRWDSRVINSLKWGSTTSPNTTKLYNKSLELTQCHDKPYIRQTWEDAGLDLTKDVWRIEFSCKSTFQTNRNKETGEIEKLTLADYDKRYKLLQRFIILYLKYFDFRIIEVKDNGEYVRKYDCERLMLMDWKDKARNYAYEPIRNLPTTTDTLRTVKQFVKRLIDIVCDSKLVNVRCSSMTLIQHFVEVFPKLEKEMRFDLKRIPKKRWDEFNQWKINKLNQQKANEEEQMKMPKKSFTLTDWNDTKYLFETLGVCMNAAEFFSIDDTDPPF